MAVGASELRKSETRRQPATSEEMLTTAAQSMGLPVNAVVEVAAVGKWHIFDGQYTKKVFGIFSSRKHKVRVLDRYGVVCLQREGLGAVLTTRAKLAEDLGMLLEDTTEYGTIGGQLPGLFAYYGEKQLDLSGLASREQVFAVLEMELADFPEEEEIVILAVR